VHPADGAWQALLDREATPADARSLREHQERCEECRWLVAALETEAAARGALLAALNAPVPPADVDAVIREARARPRTNAWRALVAAAAILLFAVVAAATVASPFLQELVARVWHRVRYAPVTVAPAPTSPEGVAPVGIALEPAGPARITFQSVQATGEIRVRIADDATKISVVASQAVPYNVRAGTVTIANAGSEASYDVTIPHSQERAIVLVGEQPVLEKDGAAITARAATRQDALYVIPFNSLPKPRERRP